MKSKSESRWGPVYLNEITAIEFRLLSPGARELWMILSARTRSAGTSQVTKKGFFVHYASLSVDMARPYKEKCDVPEYRTVYREIKVGYETRTVPVHVCQKCEGELRPISIKTVGRYIAELKKAGMVEVSRSTGASRICLIPPKSVVEKLSKTSGKPTEKTEKDVPSIGHNTEVDRTPMDVPYSKIQSKDQIHTSSSTATTIEKMCNHLVTLHKVGARPDGGYMEAGFLSWGQLCVEIPQAAKNMFRSYEKDLNGFPLDKAIRLAGIAFLESEEKKNKIHSSA